MSKKSAVVDEDVKTVESKADKFRRLMNPRLKRLERIVRQITVLANKKVYEYTQEQADIACGVVNDAVSKVSYAFATGSVAADKKEDYV